MTASCVHLQRGVLAAEQAAGILLRRDVSKALDPLKAGDFVTIGERLAQRIDGTAGAEEARAMSAALDRLDVRWASMSESRVDAVIRAANGVLSKRVQRIPMKVEAELAVDGPPLVARTRASAVRTFKLGIDAGLSERDREVEKTVRATTTNFVRDEMGRRVDELSERARGIVSRGLAGGLGSDDIGAALERGLGDRVSRGPGYWRMVANSFTNHARTYTQLAAFDEAGIEEWVFEAVLDEATSDVCRFYHGKTFSTGDAMQHVEKVLALEDPEDITKVSPWVNQGTDDRGNDFLYVKQGEKNVRIANVSRSGEGKADDEGAFTRARSTSGLTKLGAMVPPLHGDCRSTIVPA